MRARQAATHSYEGYDQPMNRVRADARQAAQRIDLLMEQQGRLLEIVAKQHAAQLTIGKAEFDFVETAF